MGDPFPKIRAVFFSFPVSHAGKIFYIVDNEDKQIAQYEENFGKENVIVFDKKKLADSIDEGNNFDERRTITHARNATFDIAKKLGVKYWIQLDDDYTGFRYRMYEKGNPLPIKNLDRVLKTMLDFYKSVNCLSVAMSQGGDFLGGTN